MTDASASVDVNRLILSLPIELQDLIWKIYYRKYITHMLVPQLKSAVNTRINDVQMVMFKNDKGIIKKNYMERILGKLEYICKRLPRSEHHELEHDPTQNVIYYYNGKHSYFLMNFECYINDNDGYMSFTYDKSNALNMQFISQLNHEILEKYEKYIPIHRDGKYPACYKCLPIIMTRAEYIDALYNGIKCKNAKHHKHMHKYSTNKGLDKVINRKDNGDDDEYDEEKEEDACYYNYDDNYNYHYDNNDNYDDSKNHGINIATNNDNNLPPKNSCIII